MNLLDLLSIGKISLNGQMIQFRTEYRFEPKRKWRFDFANTQHQIAIEIEGGVFQKGGGRHNRGSGFVGDIEKYNHAQCLGWIVLRFTTSQVKSKKRCGEYLNVIQQAITIREIQK